MKMPSIIKLFGLIYCLLTVSLSFALTQPQSYCQTHVNRCGQKINLMDENQWIKQNGIPSVNGEQENYVPSHVVFQNSTLSINATVNSKPYVNNNYGWPVIYQSGKIYGKTTTLNIGDHGLIEAEFKLDPNYMSANDHAWPAFWLLPKNLGGWPRNGEIDLFEWVHLLGTNNFQTTLHGANVVGGSTEIFKKMSNIDLSQYHDYGMTWDVTKNNSNAPVAVKLQFFLDGQLYQTWQFSYVNQPTTPNAILGNAILNGFNPSKGNGFYPIFNLAMGGQWPGEIADNVIHSPHFITIRQVYFYQLNPTN